MAADSQVRTERTSSGKGTAEGLFPDREHHILPSSMGATWSNSAHQQLEYTGVMDRMLDGLMNQIHPNTIGCRRQTMLPQSL